MLENYTKVYRATNVVNGKVYIGLTQNLEKRKKEHLKCAMNGSQGYFHRAIRKYGWDNFHWSVMYECSNRDGASVCERELIRRFDSFENGYNMTTGGEAGWRKFTRSETKKKLAVLYQGKTFEEIHGPEKAVQIRAKMSERQKGRIRSERFRSWMSENNRKRWSEGRPIGKKGHACEVNGVRYKNPAEAGRALGMWPHTIRAWSRKEINGCRFL